MKDDEFGFIKMNSQLVGIKSGGVFVMKKNISVISKENKWKIVWRKEKITDVKEEQ